MKHYFIIEMYIAFKWLVSLAFTMWLAMCFVNFYMKGCKNIGAGVAIKQFEIIFKNTTKVKEPDTDTARGRMQLPFVKSKIIKEPTTTGLHIMMFAAGVLAVTVFNKKQDIITFAKRKVELINITGVMKTRLAHLKKTANTFGVTIFKYGQILWEKIKSVSWKTIIYLHYLKASHYVSKSKIHVLLLNKLKEMGEERKNLGELLIAAIRENKNIRMRYQLETMTKNRLMQHIENTQKHIKENRSRYVSFQQLYLVTHQENVFLKARLTKLNKEKEDAEKNLMDLINEVYRSKNKELKAYCTRLVLKTKDNLLNSDVSAEIQKFLEKSQSVRSNQNSPGYSKVTSAQSWPRCTSTRVTEILHEDDSLVPLVSDAPKLKGLPGEYVWTIKDKNGIIEKLYEYDYESEFDSGDTIRRIRQYSVYFDKDCLLDFSNSRHEISTEIQRLPNNSDNILVNRRIVTGSKAFQTFLQSNTTVVPARPPASPLLRG